MLEVFAPNEVAASVPDIDLAALSELGIRGLLLDVDNTLVSWGGSQMSDPVSRWVRRANESFSLCLVSNSVRGKRMRKLADEIGIPGIAVWGMGRKPFRGGMLKALALTGTSPEETAMVGDQLLTDVAAGNRCGLYTIWVQKISAREFPVTRLNRIIEAYYARRLRRAGLMPEEPPQAGGDR